MCGGLPFPQAGLTAETAWKAGKSELICLHGGLRLCRLAGAVAPPHAENGNLFLEMSSHYRQVSRYNTRSSFLPVSADKIGGRENSPYW